jgi:hypothetical protein
MLAIEAPYPLFLDLSGHPLTGGFLYFGGVNLNPETNPVAVYWDLAGTQPAAQPIRTINGVAVRSGTPATLYIAGDYSLTIRDHAGRFVFSSASSANVANSAAALAAINNVTGPNGASLIGSPDSANYFNGTTVEAILQEIGNPKGQLQLDGVNVLRYIPPAEWPAIIAKTSTTNLYTYLQAALTAEPNLLFPDGLFNTGTKLIPRTDAKIRGMRRRGTLLKGTAANTILEFPITTFDPVVQNIRFQGTSCTGVAVAATAGTLHDYLIRPFISECDFDYDLAFGINADMIFARIEKNTFGYYGVGTQPAPGASTFVAIRAYGVTANNTNFNTLRNNIFQNAGSLAQAAVDINSGSSWLFDSNDFEQGGMVLKASNIQLLRFTGINWLEANVATNALIEIGACLTAPIFEGMQISNNTCDRVWQAPLDGTCRGLIIRNNSIGLNSPSYVLFDTISLSRLLPGNGSVAFYENNVTGGNAGNKLVSGTEFRGGLTSPRLALAGLTTTPGTISGSSDPGATISYNGVGDVSITASHPFATSVAKVLAVMTPQVGFQARVQIVNPSQVRVQVQTPAGAAVDGAFSLLVYGS